MKKIVITLCTLLAVSSGEYAKAYEVKTSDRSTTKAEPGRSGKTEVKETGPSEGAKSEASKSVKAPSNVTRGYDSDEGNFYIKNAPPVPEVASVFNLEPKTGDLVFTDVKSTFFDDKGNLKENKGATNSYTLKRADGTSYQVKFDNSGKILSRFKTEKNAPGENVTEKPYDPLMHDRNGNPITRETVQAKRTQVKQATPEAKDEARTEVETQVSKAKEENPEAVATAKAKADAIQTQAEAAIADPNPENVQAVVEQIAPEGTTSEQISQYVKQMVEFIKSMPEKGANAVKALLQAISDLISTGQIVDRSVEAPAEQLAAPTGSAYGDYGDTKQQNLFSEDSRPSTPVQSGTGGRLVAKPIRPGSPDSVAGLLKDENATPNPDGEADIFAPESAKEKTNASAGAEPSGRIQNGVYTPVKAVISSSLLNVS